MSKIKFLVSQDLKSAPLPDEIAKELDVLSGFSNVASTNVVDENPLLQIPISAARKNQNEGRSESRISTLKYICKFYYTRYQISLRDMPTVKSMVICRSAWKNQTRKRRYCGRLRCVTYRHWNYRKECRGSSATRIGRIICRR